MEVYIVLTKTGTILSKIVKFIKHHKYTRVSISLDRGLNEMYSFGRINPYNPFVGGFVQEKINQGTFKRFINTRCVVLKIDVTKEQYEKMNEVIEYFKENYKKYQFNILGLLWVIINKRKIRKNKFYCAEFVKYVIDESNIENELPFVITPNDFFYLPNAEKIYEGFLKEYHFE